MPGKRGIVQVKSIQNPCPLRALPGTLKFGNKREVIKPVTGQVDSSDCLNADGCLCCWPS